MFFMEDGFLKHLQHQPNQSKSNLSRQAPLSQQEADEKVIPQCIHSLVTPQQTGSNPLVILRCCSVGYSTMHSFSKLHRGWEWKSSLTHYPTTTTNKYPLVRFRCINVKMTREFGWDGITRWQESYSTSPIPPSYLVVWLGLFVSPMPPSYLVAWFILFVITNATVIPGCLVYLVCHQPSSPSYLVVWFVLFTINQFHHHIWLFSVFPTGMNTSVQVYLKQCWPLMLFSSVGSSGSLWFWKVPTTNGCWYHPCYSSQYHVTYKLL